MDVWEANSISTALTPHSCNPEAYAVCTESGCGGTYSDDRYAGNCDANGCDYNSYRVGVKDFYGPGKTVNTNSKFTVVTQFLGSGNTISEIKRFYVQGGKVIQNPQSQVSGLTGNSITQAYCNAEEKVFAEERYPFNEHGKSHHCAEACASCTDSLTFHSVNALPQIVLTFMLGGMASMGRAGGTGMVLVMSLWDDHNSNMLWLDSNFPTSEPESKPGVARGTCAITSGAPEDVEKNFPNAQVQFSNIKFGPIGSTFAQPSGS